MEDQQRSPAAIAQAAIQVAFWDLMYPPFVGYEDVPGTICEVPNCPDCGNTAPQARQIPVTSSVN